MLGQTTLASEEKLTRADATPETIGGNEKWIFRSANFPLWFSQQSSADLY